MQFCGSWSNTPWEITVLLGKNVKICFILSAGKYRGVQLRIYPKFDICYQKNRLLLKNLGAKIPTELLLAFLDCSAGFRLRIFLSVVACPCPSSAIPTPSPDVPASMFRSDITEDEIVRREKRKHRKIQNALRCWMKHTHAHAHLTIRTTISSFLQSTLRLSA